MSSPAFIIVVCQGMSYDPLYDGIGQDVRFCVTRHKKRDCSMHSGVQTMMFLRQILSLPISWFSLKTTCSATVGPSRQPGCDGGRLRRCLAANSHASACPFIPIMYLKWRLQFGQPGQRISGMLIASCDKNNNLFNLLISPT